MVTYLPSARAQAALDTPTGYRRRTRCTFTRNGVSEIVEPISGTFTQDARRNGRWDGRLTFAGIDLMPEQPGDLLTPFGTLCSVELGLELLTGEIAYVPYGTYEVSSASATTAPDQRTTDIGLIDLSDRIDRYRFETPLTIASGTTVYDMVNAVVLNRTGFNPTTSPTSGTLGAARVFGLETGTGPWDEILDVLDSFSLTAWYDRTGRIQLGSRTADRGSAYVVGGRTSFSVDFDTRPANVVVARGETTDGTVAVQAVAMDTDPGSPTYAGTTPGASPYGRMTEFFASPLLLTVAQAQAAAETILAGNLGAGATYTMTRPYDPTTDAGDVVSYGGTAYVVDAITLNLTGDTSMKVREVI